MEATHFLGVFTNPFHEGQTFTAEMKYGIIRGTYLGGLIWVKTVAVWRIKPTDVPLQERLEEREKQRIKELKQIISTITFLDERDINYNYANTEL